MIDEPVTLDLLGARTLAMQADIRDLKQRMNGLEMRFGAIENRISALEGRFAILEERLSGMMDLLVRVASHIGITG